MTFGTHRASANGRRLMGIALLFFCWLGLTRSADGQDLGSAELHIAGTQLEISPAAQTVPFDTPTLVTTRLSGYDTTLGTLPPGLSVVGDLVGPEINGGLRLETSPGEPFRIPRLRLKGDYTLKDIRLEQDGELLAYGEPREATVSVTRILITSVSATAMTEEEMRSYGLVIGDGNYQAFNLSFALGLLDRPIQEFVVPVVYELYGHGLADGTAAPRLTIPTAGQSGTVTSRFQPPSLTPFRIDLLPNDRAAVEVPRGGCDIKQDPCRVANPQPPPMVGVVLFPSDVSLLHQFFSVVLSVQNGAPDGDPLQVRDLTAKARIPSGLRAAETDPPTPLGVPVPVRAPGPDGEVGTADDLNLLVAQATGEAEFLVEGLQEGTHIVEFDLQGVLEGMPGGPRPIAGHAKGAVVVRDPSLGVNVTHPETVRAGEAYTLGVTLSNLGNAPVNGASFNLPASGLAGVELAPGQGSSEQVPSLLPGESALVEFEMVPLINGRVIAGTARSGSALTPTFDFEVGIRNGVALSPNSLVMPSIVEELPAHLYRELISLVGLGHSLATAPPGGNPNAPRVGRGTVHRRVYRMVEASRVLALGESDFDAISVLAAEWLGARSQDWEWDTMRRSTDRGLTTTLAFADVLEAGSASTLDAFERFAAHQTHFGLQLAAAYGPGTTLEIESLTSGKRMAHHAPSGPIRDLPFADTFTLADGDLACLTQPEEAGYRALVRRDSAGTFGLRISWPAPAGGPGAMRSLEWSGVSLGAEGLAWVNFDSVSEAAVLEIDDNGDGFADRTELPSLGVLDARPFEVVAAVQNAELDPTGHVVDVLFSTEVDLNSLGEADRFEIEGKYSNGGLTLSERALQHGGSAGLQDVGLNSPRLVRVIFNNPLSAILPDPLMTVSGVVDGLGREISPQNVIVELRATDQAIQVHGQVIDPYGQPLPFADVFLEQWDLAGLGDELRCIKHRNAAVRADAEGFYRFDYVRQTACSDRYTLVAESPHGPHKGQIGGKVRFVGADEEVNIVMVGRGVISGRVTYDDGTVPTGLQVFAHNPVFESGRRAWVGSDGSYRMAEVTVGTVTLWAQDDQGNRVFQTLEVPVAGAEVSRDLVMLKRPDQAISRLSGTVIDFHSGEPEFNAYVALYVGGARINVTRTAEDGSFDFGVVPAGTAEVEAFDGATGRRGVQVTFQLAPDEDRSLALSLRDDRGTVEGYVRRQLEDGTVVPIPDAVVWAQGTPFNTTTDATGRYVLDEVFPGNRRVLAADLVANERTQTSVTVADGQIQQADLLFVDELDIQGGLSGQVLDEDGQPVSGATLHLAGGYWSSRWAHTANTDASGFYHFPDLEPGVYGIHAYRGSSGALEFGEIRFPGDVDNVTIRFKRGVIRGRTVVRESDGSLQGVLSQITYRTTNVHSQWGLVVVDDDFSYTETDGDGYFEIEALHGPYELFFYNPFHETGYRKVSGFLGPIDPDHQVEFKQNGSISGTVYLEDGVTPAAGADVALRGGGFSDYDLTTDADGRFTFDFVPPGRYHVTATLNQGVIYRTERVYAQMRRHGAEMDIDVVLQRQGRVEGTVLDAGGIAVHWAVDELRDRGFPFRRLVRNADDNGQYAFDNIFEGELTLRAKAPDLGGLSGHVYADLFEEDDVVDTQITLEGAADIRGRVFNPENGEPVPNARVSVFGNGHLGAFVDSTQTDSDGYYEIRGLKLRDYGLRVFDPATGRRGRSPGSGR
ncbi:MAG: carboxypeptidase regulatory-like domain-containing protein, partial [Acidobacteriota bacterium]